MNMAIFAVYGASGCGREVMPVARDQLLNRGGSRDQLVFVDDRPQSALLNGHNVLTYDEFMDIEAEERYVALAIADSSTRKRLAGRILDDGAELWQVVADNVVIMDEVELMPGGILSPFVTLGSNAKIGACFHANVYSYVAHDCQIGDFVTLAPGVKCNGNVVIEDHAYIGAGAIIRQGTPERPLIIGKGAVVGMGAVVTKNISAGITVLGNPAVPMAG